MSRQGAIFINLLIYHTFTNIIWIMNVEIKYYHTIEKAYQESIYRAPAPDLKNTHWRGTEEIKKFMAKRRISI